MKTIAIWFNSKTPSEKTEVPLDLHINFWKLKERVCFFRRLFSSPQKYFLDFGFKVGDINNLEKLNIHFPFEINRSDIEDLGTRLLNNKELTKSVFNENYQIHPGDAVKQVGIQNKSKETLFNIYELDFQEGSKDSIFEKIYDGTTLSINLKHIKIKNDCSAYYFRFRLKGKALANFKRDHEPKNWFFQSAFTAAETIDFRINEKRNYNRSLVDTIDSKNEFKIEKIHFLLMRDATEEFESQHINFTCRTLEPELWDNYIDEDCILKDVIAYHWHEKIEKRPNSKPIESFNTLVKMKYNRTNLKTISAYVLIIGLMSIFFNLSSSWILQKYKSKFASNVERVETLNLQNQHKNEKKVVFQGKEVIHSDKEKSHD